MRLISQIGVQDGKFIFRQSKHSTNFINRKLIKVADGAWMWRGVAEITVIKPVAKA